MIKKIIPLLKNNKLIVKAYQRYKGAKKIIRSSLNLRYSKPLTKEDIIQLLPMCGIYPKDKIVVNSSLSAIGNVNGGALTVVDALKEYITPEGLIVMPSYPHRGMFQYLENYSTFDIRKTPSKNGIITEIFRKSEGVYRSLHPTHPLCFWGKLSEELYKGHEISLSPYDYNSPYKKLLDLDVKNFCIGVDFEHMIMIRVVDDLYEDYPAAMYFENKTYKVPVVDYNGNTIAVETKCHDPQKSLVRHNMNLYKYMLNDIIESKLGKAKTITLSSQKMFEHQKRLSKKGVFPYFDTSFFLK